MTTREKQVTAAIAALGGIAHPTAIGKELGISGDYAEQICRDLVWRGVLEKVGLKFKLLAPKERKHEKYKVTGK